VTTDAQSLVLGTAGHIDHGKTALVRALTGRDLDRLPEEKARGITIELGFAPLELSDGLRLAVVDVPGHERFVRTMVAGASGLDLLMLVVAADEGVMPQTREHLAICELLGIDRGLVVLTKSDLVDEEMIELASEEVRDLLADGSLANIPILSASSETGEGIDRVRATLEDLIRTAPARSDDGRPSRLFIDRTFTKHGFGTVVTGTWSGRSRKIGDTVVLEPGSRKAKIRGLERHGETIQVADSGSRIAVNLQREGKDEIQRPRPSTPACIGWRERQPSTHRPRSNSCAERPSVAHAWRRSETKQSRPATTPSLESISAAHRSRCCLGIASYSEALLGTQAWARLSVAGSFSMSTRPTFAVETPASCATSNAWLEPNRRTA